MAKPAEATLGDISLNRLAVCECSDFNVCFVLEPLHSRSQYWNDNEAAPANGGFVNKAN